LCAKRRPYSFDGDAKSASNRLLDVLYDRGGFRLERSEFPYFVFEYDGGAVAGKTDLEFLFRDGSNAVAIRAINQRSLQFYAFSGPSTNLKGLLLDVRRTLGWRDQDSDLLLR